MDGDVSAPRTEAIAPELAPAGPAVDVDSAFFWEGLAKHRLLILECTACRERRFPPVPSCPYCGGVDSSVQEETRGVIYSWVTVHRALDPAFAHQVPYTLATIDLRGGGRLVARLEPAAGIAPDLQVVAKYVDQDGWTELRFTPDPGPAIP
jgi:uncharacterized OB-fold protein